MRLRVLAVLGLGVLALSWAAPVFRLTTSPVVAVAAWRMLLGGALFLPWVPRVRWSKRGLVLGVAAGGVLALHFFLWLTSLRLTTVASSVALVTTNPIFVGLLSWVLGEPPSRRLWEGIALSVTGAMLIGWGDFAIGGQALVGDALALGGALAASTYLLLGRRARQEVNLLPYVGLAYGVAGVLLLIAAAGAGTPVVTAQDWLWVSILAVGPQALGHTNVNWALRRLPASAVAVGILGEPVGATLWAFLLFSEGVGIVQGVGILLVFLGILRAWRAIRL